MLRQPAHKKPAQAIRPSGRPMPHTTMFTHGKTSAGRLVHCSPGGLMASPLDSAWATPMLATQSGLGCKVRMVVSPVVDRNVIGCVTRKARKATTPARASRRPASTRRRYGSLRACQSGANAMTAATTISAAKGTRLMREASDMPKKRPKRAYQNQVWGVGNW